MPTEVIESDSLQGLSKDQIPLLQRQYGKNIFRQSNQHRFLHILWNIAREPMFILLVISCSLYFVLGNTNEGIMMAVAMLIVVTISLYQEVRSSHALKALEQFTEPKVTAIRNGIQQVVSNEDLVPGDIILAMENQKTKVKMQNEPLIFARLSVLHFYFLLLTLPNSLNFNRSYNYVQAQVI
jgi:P-type Ca2+ transporter type 2C